jgi:hypothetical protein
MATSSEFVAWLTALGLGIERGWKIYSDHRNQKKEDKTVSITEGDSLFRRANEMMDRLESDAKALREENIHLRRRVADLEEELGMIRRLMRENGIAVPFKTKPVEGLVVPG